MLMWFIVIVVFSLLVLVHEVGHLVAAKKAGIKVEVFSLGMGRRLFGWTVGSTDYRLSLIPFGGYCKMAGEDPLESEGREDEFNSKSPGQKFWVIVAGSLTNYIFAFLVFCVIFMMGAPVLSNKIGEVFENMPAYEADLREGDRIVAIGQNNVEYWDDILQNISAYDRERGVLEITILRDGEELRLDLVPRIQETVNIFQQRITRPMIGIAPSEEMESVSYSFFPAAYNGAKRLFELTATTYKGIWLLVTGALPLESSVSGPVGIAHIMGEAARMGLVPLLLITAHVSLALAVFNLLPFPILDGGHLLFIAVEKLRGRPVSPHVQEKIAQIALVLLLTFAIFVTWQDVLRFTPIGN